ncbi:MAG TPA: PAS domain-containing protein [Candidatus Limnocylindria bacterium]|nr:PAS domain-containing protein [Candidatus Limnocylindria bacterium]
MANAVSSAIRSYGLATLLVLGMFAVSLVLRPISEPFSFMLFFLVALVVARLAGLAPGLFATAIGAWAVHIVVAWSEPKLFEFSDVLRLAGFIIVSGVGCWVVASLRSTKQRMSRILDAISEGFVVVDRDWRCIYVNRKAAEFVRRPRQELIGKPILSLFPGIGDTPLFLEVRGAMSRRASARIEAYHPGVDKWFEASLIPTADGLTAFIRDITEHRQDQEQLQKTMADLSRSNAELEKFAAIVAHDLVQPVAAMSNWATLIRDATSGKIRDFASRICDRAAQMAELLKGQLAQSSVNGNRDTSTEPTVAPAERAEAAKSPEQEASGTAR